MKGKGELKMAKANYEVKINEKKGACDSQTFEKMAKNGDLQSEKVSENVGKVIRTTGYALCEITAGDKEFEMNYYSTDEGLLSSGSTIFRDSVKEYIDDIDLFKIVSIKTKKGTTYKVTPILNQEEA